MNSTSTAVVDQVLELKRLVDHSLTCYSRITMNDNAKHLILILFDLLDSSGTPVDQGIHSLKVRRIT